MNSDIVLPDVVSSFSKIDVANACRRWSKYLWAPAGINGAQLLWAISGNESSFGANCKPRHETGYCTGSYSRNSEVQALTAQYAHGAHCSYGPWQIMLVNCGPGTSPQDISSVDRAAMETVSFINRRIFKLEGASTVEQVAAAYNSGTWKHPAPLAPGIQRYVDECLHNYGVPMPEPAQESK